MERSWELIKTAGGVLLIVVAAIYLAGSGHAGHLLRNTREFAVAADHIAGSIAREISLGLRWLIAQGR